MINSINEFAVYWKSHSEATSRILSALTDSSLDKRVSNEDRTLGRVAWHIVNSIPEMAGHLGLRLEGPKHDAPVPKTAGEIKDGYDKIAASLLAQVTGNWDDKTLQIEDNLYGQIWKRGLTLQILIDHEIHHRGQLTVLMRQAGLKVPGIFGPAREEWADMGMKPPEV
jgi:uncharacterized damage-inducible protein DinB